MSVAISAQHSWRSPFLALALPAPLLQSCWTIAESREPQRPPESNDNGDPNVRPSVHPSVRPTCADRGCKQLSSTANAKKKKFFIGLKLVRGAYHEQEISRAENMNYPCPVHKTKEKTDKDYNKALKICIKTVSYTHLRAHETREDRGWRGVR